MRYTNAARRSCNARTLRHNRSMDLYVEKAEKAGAQLVIPRETARGILLVLNRLSEVFDVSYSWVHDENNKPVGVLLDGDEFRRLRRAAGEPLA